MKREHEMTITFDSSSENESFARTVIAAFIARLDPTLEELSDVKTAVSEAVTNAIIHGYEGEQGEITIHSRLEGNTVFVEVSDSGVGIRDIQKAMEPLYTTKPELERSGMGFAFMDAFMDKLEVSSKENEGTVVRMTKEIKSALPLS